MSSLVGFDARGAVGMPSHASTRPGHDPDHAALIPMIRPSDSFPIRAAPAVEPQP